MSEETKKSRGRPAKFDSSKMVDLYKQGKTIAEVATEIGCSKQSVMNNLKKAGVTMPKRSKQVETTTEESVAV